MNALKLGMEKSSSRAGPTLPKLIEALEGLEMKEGDDFPQGDKTLRKGKTTRRCFSSSSSRSRTASTRSSR
jgi:hypothetical protein